MDGNKDKVFVVHGRNFKAKEQMFIFLRSLGLRPIEWEQSARLTAMSAPHTLDVVKAGLESAQCVIVLLTADEITKLRTAYGTENYRFQPRPNVIFEAGWALGVAGQERTILVRFEEIGQISDIDGLNYIFLSNDAESRKALIARLKTAGCMIDDSGTDYLSSSRGGDFSSSFISPEDDVDISDRGKFTEIIVDGTLSYDSSNIHLRRELRSDIKDGRTINLKYHYLGVTCANHWLAVSQNVEYGHAQLKDFIARNFAPALRACNLSGGAIDFVSLGAGDGKIDEIILCKLINENIKLGYYYCIDISFELLQHAVANIVNHLEREKLAQKIKIKAIQGDFTKLKRYSPIYAFDQSINLFILTGFTLGNYNESELLSAIREGMGPKDLLFLDARLHELNWDGIRDLEKGEKELISSNYKNDLNVRFAFGPLESATNLSYETTNFEYEINSTITSVPKAVNLIIYCTDVNAEFRDKREKIKKDRLNLAATTIYNYESLENWFSAKGFRVIWKERNRNIGLFMLQKKFN